MKDKSSALKIGDSVVVKKGIQDPDTGGSIGGWQGRIVDIGEDDKGDTYIGIQWDSITLQNTPLSLIEEMEEKGLDWASFYLGAEEVEPATERDTKAQVETAIEEIGNKVGWIYLGEEGRRIQTVLSGISRENTMASLKAWNKFLKKNLDIPFDARISEYQDRGPLQSGDKVSVTGFTLVDDLYGIIVELWRKQERFDFPLCDLEVTNKESPNYQPVNDYCVWFANR